MAVVSCEKCEKSAPKYIKNTNLFTNRIYIFKYVLTFGSK